MTATMLGLDQGHAVSPRGQPSTAVAAAEWVMCSCKPFRARQALSFIFVQHRACFGFVSWFLGAALKLSMELQVGNKAKVGWFPAANVLSSVPPAFFSATISQIHAFLDLGTLLLTHSRLSFYL